jgi:hypothetical protein
MWRFPPPDLYSHPGIVAFSLRLSLLIIIVIILHVAAVALVALLSLAYEVESSVLPDVR